MPGPREWHLPARGKTRKGLLLKMGEKLRPLKANAAPRDREQLQPDSAPTPQAWQSHPGLSAHLAVTSNKQEPLSINLMCQSQESIMCGKKQKL